MQQAKDAASQEIDNKVFDDYEVHTRVFNLRDPKNAENKDYGDFFEEEVPEGDDKKGAPQATVPVKKQAPASDQEVMNAKAPFRREEIRDDQEPAGRSKSFIFGIIAIILAALVALAALAVFAVQNGLLPFGQEDTRPTAAPATEKATVEPPVTVPTAAPETTVPEETEPTEPTTEEIVDEDVTPRATTMTRASSSRCPPTAARPSREAAPSRSSAPRVSPIRRRAAAPKAAIPTAARVTTSKRGISSLSAHSDISSKMIVVQIIFGSEVS